MRTLDLSALASALLGTVLLFVGLSSARSDQLISGKKLADLNSYEANALFLAQGAGTNGLIDEGLVQEIVTALSAIVSKYPAMQKILDRGEDRYRSVAINGLSMSLADGVEATVDASGVEIAGPPRPYRSPGERSLLSTGIGDLDRLNEHYGVDRITILKSSLWKNPFLHIYFGRNVDLLSVIPIYESLKEVDHVAHWRVSRTVEGLPFAKTRTVPGSYLSEYLYTPDGHSIVFIPKGGRWHFVFKLGGGDCPAGCTQNSYFYFTYDRKSSSVSEDNQFLYGDKSNGLFLWSVPTSHPLFPFTRYGEIASMAHSDSWWLRVHALDALGFALTSPNRETYRSSYQDSAALDALLADIATNRNAALRLLIQSLGDSDEDVRAVAHFQLVQNAKVDYGRETGSVEKWLSWLEAETP